jgi:TrmH family RNA methyltransferase
VLLRERGCCVGKGKTYSTHAGLDNVKLLTLARDLGRRKARDRDHLFVAEGIRAVEELVRSRLPIRGALLAPQLTDTARGSALAEALAGRTAEVRTVTDREFGSAAQTESPQGILAIGEIPGARLSDLTLPSTARLLILDAVQDPGNVGTILRTAAGLGVAATIVLPGTVDVWNAKVVRSAMGAQFVHPAFRSTWAELDPFLVERNIVVWGADARGVPPDAAAAPSRLALVMGNEGSGLRDDARERCVHLVGLPIIEAVESLNVAVAAGILLYALRQ